MKKRLDVLVAEQEGVSRAKAQALILAGQILVEGKMADKAGTEIDEKSEIKVKEKFPYVSRGALKLEAAAREFKIDFKGKIVCDVGASTGGFTDFALQNGAKKVYAIDTGYGQIAGKLRDDSRVVLMERTNIKKVETLPEQVDIFVIDVSFISLKQVLPAVKKIITTCHSREGGNLYKKEVDPRVKPEDDRYGVTIVALIKPQFEVGKEIANKTKGIIKDEKVQLKVVEEIGQFAEKIGCKVQGLTESPITGAKGNKEFLVWLKS